MGSAQLCNLRALKFTTPEPVTKTYLFPKFNREACNLPTATPVRTSTTYRYPEFTPIPLGAPASGEVCGSLLRRRALLGTHQLHLRKRGFPGRKSDSCDFGDVSSRRFASQVVVCSSWDKLQDAL